MSNVEVIIMKRISLFITFLFFFCIQLSYAQRNNNSKYEEIALNYVCESKKALDRSKCRVKESSYKKLSNGYVMVDITIVYNDKYIEELHATDGNYFAQDNGFGNVSYSKTAYRKKEREWLFKYIVFISNDGTPLKYDRRPNYFDIETWNNYYWFFLDKHSCNLGGANYKVYDYIECRTMDGEPLWKLKDMVIFCVLKTDNNVYVAGEKVGDDVRSMVRGYNIKTGKVVYEKIGDLGNICIGINSGDEGLNVTEFVNKTNRTQKYTIPYEANEKAIRKRQIMSRYSQNKASDQVEIGERYLKGNGFDKDEKLAFNWFKKAADQKNDKGMERLAFCYKNGLGVKQDKEKAVSYYEESAKAGNTDAIKSVIKMYVDGDGIPKNMSRAFYWQETLAFKGDIEAQKYVISHKTFEYEKANITSNEVNQLGSNAYKANNFDWAWFCFERGAAMGNEQSKYNQGLMYMEGKGVAKNYAKAIDYMSGSAEKGDVVAQYYIATMYNMGDMGNGFNRDGNKYIYWLTRAAENGHEDALYQLAQSYENGTSVKKNLKTAVEIYERIPKKNLEVKIKLVYIYAAGIGVKKDLDRAKYYFDTLPANIEGDIADDIFWGRGGVKKNKKLGLELYKKAAAKGNKEALKSYQLWSK